MTHWMLSSAEDKQVLWWASSDNGLKDYSVKKKRVVLQWLTLWLVLVNSFYLSGSKYLSLYIIFNKFFLFVSNMHDAVFSKSF